MRTVFLGTSDFAAAVLRRLCEERRDGAPHRPALVLTRPDRPAGRGRRLTSPPVAGAARELGLRLEQPLSVNDVAAHEPIAAAEPEAVVVCAFGALVNEPLLSRFQMLNVHPSLLPRWRGAAPVERAIMAGDERTGVSIMRLTAGLDSGPVCLAATEPIASDDDYGTLAGRLQPLGGDLLVQALDRLGAGEPLPFAEQDESGVTYAEKIGPADRLLDPSRPSRELERVVRALHPHIGARLELADGSFLGVRRALAFKDGPVEDAPAGGGSPPAKSRPPGGGLYRSGERLFLPCSPGTLELLEVQPAGGRPMDAAAYLRGHGLPRA